MPGTGTQVTCFTGTKVQILTPEELRGRHIQLQLSEDGSGIGAAIIAAVASKP